MKTLKSIPGVEHYLENDCYCRHEIYSSDGFFYQLFKPEEECKYLGKNETHHMVICKDQLILFYIHKDDDNKIVDSTRYDATENNIELAVLLLEKGFDEVKKQDRKLDSFPDNNTNRNLKKIFDMADAIMISNNRGS